MVININQAVKFVITQEGADALNSGKTYGKTYTAGQEVRMQLWDLMNQLGPNICMGGPQMIELNNIEII